MASNPDWHIVAWYSKHSTSSAHKCRMGHFSHKILL